MPQPFSENANYRNEIRAILRLHRLWMAGKGESQEADAIRDDDRPWRLLTEVERKRIRGLSEDLNSISDPPPSQGAAELNAEAHAKLAGVNDARQRGDWDRALELLRAAGKNVPPALASYLRGSIWLQAGDAEVAVVFIEHAAQLEPDSSSYRALALSMAGTSTHTFGADVA